MAIEQIDQRRRRRDDRTRRQRCVRRIHRAELLLLDLEDALLDGRIVEQEHLLDQAIELANSRSLAPMGAEMGDDVPLRPPEQAGEMRVPDRLIGGQETNDFALCLHRPLRGTPMVLAQARLPGWQGKICEVRQRFTPHGRRRAYRFTTSPCPVGNSSTACPQSRMNSSAASFLVAIAGSSHSHRTQRFRRG